MNALNLTTKYEDYMTGLRRWFHENPELSGKEYETIRKIDAELTAMGIEHTIVENGGHPGMDPWKESQWENCAAAGGL